MTIRRHPAANPDDRETTAPVIIFRHAEVVYQETSVFTKRSSKKICLQSINRVFPYNFHVP